MFFNMFDIIKFWNNFKAFWNNLKNIVVYYNLTV